MCDGLLRSARGVREDAVRTRWVEMDLIHRRPRRELAVTLRAFKTVFHIVVLDGREQVPFQREGLM